MKRIRVLYVFPQARSYALRAYQRGRSSNLSLQGIPFMHRIAPFFSDRAFSCWNLLHWFFLPLEKLFIATVGCGFKLDQAVLLLPELRNADVIVTTSDSAGQPFLWLKRIGLLKKPIVHITHGLADAVSRRPTRTGLWATTLLRHARWVVCYARAEKDMLIRQFGLPAESIVVIPFGADTDFYSPMRQRRDNFILAVGRDLGRDYETLFRAVRGQPWEVRLVCDPINIRGLTVPLNVHVSFNISEKKLRLLYAQARCVVLPLKDIFRPTGQIVLLQSLSMGVPTVVTRVPGITTAYSLKDKQDCLFVEPDDATGLRRAISWIYRHPKESRAFGHRGSAFVQSHYTQKIFAKKMEEVILSV